MATCDIPGCLNAARRGSSFCREHTDSESQDDYWLYKEYLSSGYSQEDASTMSGVGAPE